jgi:tetratricopeptide (TPR) repeat protein
MNRLGLISGLLIAAAGLQAPTALAQGVPASVSQGYVLLNRGWVNDAIAAFQSALKSNPRSLDARLGLAIAYQRAGQDSAAWQAYQNVLVQDPNNRTALQAVGQLGSYRSEWQAQGIAALTTLLQLTPTDLAARSQRALLYGYQGLFGESLADYQIVLQTAPKPDVILAAAQIATYSGDYPQGLTLFNRYTAGGQSLPDSAITAYALALRESGKPEQAIQILRSRLSQRQSLDRLAIELRTGLAVAYQTNQQPDDALATLEPLRGKPVAALPLARALSAIGRQAGNVTLYQEAIALYRQVLQQTTTHSPGLLTEVADVLGEVPETRADALSLYQQLIKQQPQNKSLLVKYLWLENQLGQIQRTDVIQQLQTALQPLPDSAAERRLLAQTLVHLDPPPPQLLPIYRDLVQSGVEQPFLQFRIAQMLIQQGDLSAARDAIAAYRATPRGQQDFAAEFLLAEIDRRDGNLDGSAARYEAILAGTAKPSVQIDALRGLAGIRQAQGRLQDALALYDQLLSRNPQDMRAQLGRASLAYQANRLSEAEAEAVLETWVHQASVSGTPPELISLVSALPANPSREALYTTLLQRDPTNGAIQRRLIQTIALRDPNLARSQVNQLVARDPENLTAYFIQGELAQSLGDLPLASQAYQAILHRQPDQIDALAALAGVRFQQQQYAEATTLYQQVLAKRPKDADIRRLLAELKLAQDQPFAALELFRQAQQEQVAQGISNPVLTKRIQRLEVDRLRRRGFQPDWERY